MEADATARGQNRPPINSAVGHAVARLRPTARVRPTLPVGLTPCEHGFEASDPYVRKFWVAALGPGAVAELLRMARAAQCDEEVRLPRHLPQLLKAGLVSIVDGRLSILERIPTVPPNMRWRFSPEISAEHKAWLAGTT